VTYAVISTGDENSKKLVPGKKTSEKQISQRMISASPVQEGMHSTRQRIEEQARKERKKERRKDKTRMQS
jgi:hypothetical protein